MQNRDLLDGYLAGLFDGEGYVQCSVYHRRHSKTWTAVGAVIVITDRAPLLLFAARFPGGRIRQCRPRKLSTKPVYEWKIQGRKAREFLTFIAEHAVIKRAQALVALEVVGMLQEYRAGHTKLSEESSANRFALARRVAELKKIPVHDALVAS